MSKLLFKRIKSKAGFGPKVTRVYQDINPEDIFLDSANLPGFEEHALEGRLERPMGSRTFAAMKVLLSLLLLVLVGKLWFLGIKDGHVYAEISENNRLAQTLLFANRGAILDRNGVELATNDIKDDGADFAGRHYAEMDGLAHVVGYIKYPLRDKSGNYYEKDYKAKDGAEMVYDDLLRGKNGSKLVETDVEGNVTSESVVDKPEDGQTVTLSIDAKITEEFYKAIKNLAQSSKFVGGAGVIMNVETGEILALTSYPQYDQNSMTKGIDQATFNSLISNPGKPFLNRVVGGLYTPGSIVKPIVAIAALKEGIISPNKEILSTGAISVPNPYDPSKPSIFKDWKAHGWTDMAEAIAVSSDTYFYSIGGGYGDQRGLGITLLDRYFEQFGLKDETGIELFGELKGVIPTPEWKKEKFNGDIWRLGDTYITSIGQYGTQVTPINAVRFIGAVANKGKLLKPSLVVGGDKEPVVKTLEFPESEWQVVQEGMRESVTYGTSVGLNVPYVEAAGKTGTAEIGAGKSYVHSWSVGFFPYKNPKYAWAVIMEKGPATNAVGATSVMRQLFDWMSLNAPEYFKG
jgi:penicillin-binding protein 2